MIRSLTSVPALMAGLAVLLWFGAAGLKDYGIYVLTLWLVMSIAAMGLNLTLGYAGLKSLAQAAFLGIGAYTTALLTTKGIVPWPVAFVISGGACFLVGLVLGFPALRVKVHYLAFVTLAFSTIIYLILRNEQWLTGGTFGLSNIQRPEIFGISTLRALPFFRFVLLVTLALSLAMWWLIRSPWGRAFLALRENPLRAASVGVDIRLYTLLAFAIGAAYGGFAGALYAPLVEFIDPAPFALSASFMLLLTVVVGGSGYFFAPFLGCLLSYVMPEWLRIAGGSYLIIYAGIVLVLLIFVPKGILGGIERIHDRRRDRAAAAARDAAKPMLGEGAKP